jgi:hypothetical protein
MPTVVMKHINILFLKIEIYVFNYKKLVILICNIN